MPRILYTYLQRAKQDRTRPEAQAAAIALLRRFPTYERFERRLTRKSATLTQYLETHRLVEPIQTLDALPYFVNRLLRGAYVFEHIAYLELRYNPYFRLRKGEEPRDLVEALAEIVSTVSMAAAATVRDFPIFFTQILCMDSRLPLEVNRAILRVAREMDSEVCAVDLAGPDELYREREDELVALLREAKEAGLNTTVHCYETPDGCIPAFLEYADRIGHGIQIALREPRLLTQVARRGQCLEICPTTYFRTGTLRSYEELAPIFRHCFDLGIDIAIGTDNSALHGVRLPAEFERLLTHGVLDFSQMERCRQAAFRHAFRWPGVENKKERA